jgi:hypothetical protein
LPEYLTKRHGVWQFIRRVPDDLAHLDPRQNVKESTGIKIDEDRWGNPNKKNLALAGKIADEKNRELEAYWKGLLEGRAHDAKLRYHEARRRARTFGYDYLEAEEATASNQPLLDVLGRLEKLLEAGRIKPADVEAVLPNYETRAALLGYEKRPAVKLSEVFSKFEKQNANEVAGMSKNQIKRWTNGYTLAMTDLISVIGDKDLIAITHADILEYTEWLEDRVSEGELVVKTANKYIGHNSKMIKEINRRLRLGLPDLFSGMRLKGSKNVSRPPFEAAFVQKHILADGALMGLNDEARRIVMVIADTGLRLSEAVNLTETTIHLGSNIPYVEVKPEGRHVKSEDSIRQIPLVGTALMAMRLQPKGFPRYADRGATVSAYVNEYLLDKGLRPTRMHKLYSLRHTFQDRLKAAKAQDSMIDELMGHSGGKGYKYGDGHPLETKLELLQRIAFKPPRSI